MEISEDEISYVLHVHHHGMNQLNEDAFPNKVICIHSVHWVIEYLLRKATHDYQGIDYKAGFEIIFKKFCIPKNNVSPKLQRAVQDFNTIRNGIEHRSLIPDFLDLKKKLKKMSEFIIWIMKSIFKQKNFDLFQIPVYQTEEIYADFQRWRIKKIKNELPNLSGNKDFYSSVFICAIPSTFNSDLLNLDSDTINEMRFANQGGGLTVSSSNPKHYPDIVKFFNDISPLYHGIPIDTPDYVKIETDIDLNKIFIYKDGRIYIQKFINSIYFEDCSKKHIFDLNHAVKDAYSYDFSINPEKVEKYNLPFENYTPNSLIDILKIILFAFHPDNKKKLVKNPTDYFSFKIQLFPSHNEKLVENLYLGNLTNERRFRNEFFRKYIGEDLFLQKNFSGRYSDIEEFLGKAFSYFAGYFKNDKYISFGN